MSWQYLLSGCFESDHVRLVLCNFQATEYCLDCFVKIKYYGNVLG